MNDKPARGSVFKRKGAKYYTIKFKDNRGRWVSRTTRQTNKALAGAELTSIVGAVNGGTYTPPKDILFRDLCDKWLAKSKGEVKPTTFISYRGHIENYLKPRFGHLQTRSINAEMIDLFKADLSAESKISANTIAHLLTTLKSIFKTAETWGYVAKSPAVNVKKPRVPKVEMDFLSAGEINKLLAATDPRHYALMLCACMTGMRRAELLALRWPDVDFNSKTIGLKKQAYKGQLVDLKTAHSRRRVSISDTLINALREHQVRQLVDGPQNPLELVFPSEAGTPMDPGNLLRRIFWPTLTTAGLRRIRFHDLRHSYAALAISRNVPLMVVSRQLGHGDVSLTARVYCHLLPETESAAALEVEAAIFAPVK